MTEKEKTRNKSLYFVQSLVRLTIFEKVLLV